MRKIKGFFKDLMYWVLIFGFLAGIAIYKSPTLQNYCMQQIGMEPVPVKTDTIKKETTKVVTKTKVVGLVPKDTIHLDYEENHGHYLKVVVNGLPMRFLLDTGCTDVQITNLEVGFMHKHGMLPTSCYVGEAVATIADGSQVKCGQWKLSSVKIGKTELTDVECGAMENSNAELLIGQTVLEKLGTVSIDYKKHLLLIY